MICRGKYLWGFFHSWGKWQTKERENATEFFTGSTTLSPASTHKQTSVEFFQLRQCSVCGKSQGEKVA